jgi:hypothetical protein
LRVQAHELQHIVRYIVRYIGVDGQPEQFRPLIGDRKVVGPCAFREKPRQLINSAVRGRALQQLLDGFAELKNGFLGLIGQNEGFIFYVFDRFLGDYFENGCAAGKRPSWGSTGPSTACSDMTISSAAREIKVPPDIA